MPKRCVIRCIIWAVNFSRLAYEVQSDVSLARLRVSYPAIGRKEPMSIAQVEVQAKSATFNWDLELTKIYKSELGSFMTAFGKVISPH
jgi:hypothetical protein